MSNLNEQFVKVRRQWNDSGRIGTVRRTDISGVHWDNMSGGVYAPAPQYFLHAYIWCDVIVEGEIAHSCSHGIGPHNIKVCITKKDNVKIFPDLAAEAGPKPK